ncbi:MAG: helix-turn-helix domain-containing protein [Candidatus Eremiobacteraeota bacterium]|nr:helix-turn-helix domain-containing protein [Candidatus Eremiobacteraeota bacterium]
MELDWDHCYHLISARDARYDGLFYTGVTTTGIYCRPTCPARTPKRANVRFFRSSAEAKRNGFRPCLRCRPELAPESFSFQEPSGVLARGLNLIAEGALDEAPLSALATRLNVSDRHLRRLFDKHLGAAPSEVASARRLEAAKRLLDQTSMSMTEVAFASGFSSLRRFNQAFSSTYGCPPSRLRGQARSDRGLTLRLGWRGDYDWAWLWQYLGARAIGGLETVRAGLYRRLFRVEGHLCAVEVTPRQNHLLVRLEGELQGPALAAAVRSVSLRVSRLFDLAFDPLCLAGLSQDALVGRWLPGIRVPACWDGFEMAVRAVLGQQVSVAAATTICGRVVERFGGPGEFPKPEVLAEAPLEEVGLPGKRAACLRGLAARVAEGQLNLDSSLSEQDLEGLPGIGPWTRSYLAMRVGRQPNAFPAGDLVLRKMAGNLTGRQLEQRSADWQPWRAYAAMALWKGATQ